MLRYSFFKTRYSKAGHAINSIADRLVKDVILRVDERALCLLDLESYLIARTSFEWKTRIVLKQLLRQDNVFMDGGAHIDKYTVFAGEFLRKGRLYNRTHPINFL